jgi:hypothetical protein
MQAFRFSGMLVLFGLVAQPCSMSYTPKVWAKNPASQSRLFAFEKDGRVGFIDSTGRVAIKPTIKARIDQVGDFVDGLARVGTEGFIDEAGNWVIRGKYFSMDDFSDGLAKVTVDDPVKQYEHNTLYLDKTGMEVARVPGFRGREFSEGLAPYEGDHKPNIRKFEPGKFTYMDYPGPQGFIDRAGKIVIQPTFAAVGPFVGGLARAVLDGYCHIATPDGGQQGSPTSGYPGSCGGAPADAFQPCGTGFIDTSGRFAIQPHFESARDFKDGLAAVRVHYRWGFIDKTGSTVVNPQFEEAQSFSEGLAAVKQGGKWGFIDRTGKVVIQPRFKEVEPFSDSLAIAFEGERPFYIDRGGDVAIPGPFLEATPFVHGIAAVLVGLNHVQYINKNGTAVFQYFRRNPNGKP